MSILCVSTVPPFITVATATAVRLIDERPYYMASVFN